MLNVSIIKVVIDEYKIEHFDWAQVFVIKSRLSSIYLYWWNVNILSFIADKHQYHKTGGFNLH